MFILINDYHHLIIKVLWELSGCCRHTFTCRYVEQNSSYFPYLHLVIPPIHLSPLQIFELSILLVIPVNCHAALLQAIIIQSTYRSFTIQTIQYMQRGIQINLHVHFNQRLSLRYNIFTTTKYKNDESK
jgi:hypothetical protein